MANAVPRHNIPELSSVWFLRNFETQLCLVCSNPIHPDALIRTFCVVADETTSIEEEQVKKIFALGRRFDLYDRHFDCLRSTNVHFISVSHVWDQRVSRVQYAASQGQNNLDPSELAFTAVTIFDNAIKTYEGIAKHFKEDRIEIWYDYISVPQWNEDVKVKILLKIPDIYYHSHCTVVHMHDVDRSSLDQIRVPGDSQTLVRLQGITDICNAQWFRRVWTAMEYMRSRHVRVMMRNYRVCDESDDLFLDEMFRVWNAETKLHNSSLEVEQMAQMGKNLVPWQLGVLNVLKKQKRTIFAEAYSQIVLRGCSAELDFYYAILGLVESTTGVQELSRTPEDALRQIIRICLEARDYSPLLMVPNMQDRYPMPREYFGLVDVTTWGLGEGISPAQHGVSLRNEQATFKAQRIGNVRFIESLDHILDPSRSLMSTFASLAPLVSRFTGTKVEDFVTTLGSRICGQDSGRIMRRLAKERRYERLQNILREQNGCHVPWPTDYAEQASDDLGLSNTELQLVEELETVAEYGDVMGKTLDTSSHITPLEFFRLHGSTMHLSRCSGLICAPCPTCKQNLVFRAALYIPHERAYGGVAYRIPGLRYLRSLPDGMGIIVKDNIIVGRMIYAYPECLCNPTEEISVGIPNICRPGSR